MMIRRSILAVAIAAIALSQAHSQKKQPDGAKQVFTNSAEAGPDFLIQGEYEGKLGADKAGAQVVALGDSKFDVYLLPGGLPGAGWNQTDKFKGEALAKDQTVSVSGKLVGSIAEGKLVGKTDDGKEFSLTRVERKSPTLGAKPPEGAIILFNGTNADGWTNGKIVEENLLSIGVTSKQGIALGKFHLEFRTPYQPKARGQGRGNSGVFLHGSEIQVLDSFGLTGANNECGAFYGKRKPDVNMCFPPLSWQTYDVDIRQQGDALVETVSHNGVIVHQDFVVKKGPVKPANIQLQNHGNPVVYRNIWFLETK
jgi:hypothetical protein